MPTTEDARRIRGDARRREAAQLLRLVAEMAAYASHQAGNGLAPEAARQVVVEAAAELSAAADSLRHLARLDPDERRRLALLWVGSGVPVTEVAARLGASPRTVHR